jgi:hypothetical protein
MVLTDFRIIGEFGVYQGQDVMATSFIASNQTGLLWVYWLILV